MRRMPHPSLAVALTAAMLFVFAGCQKGDTGPAGPAGPAGPQGAQGPQGPKGDSTTANIIYSNWLTVTYTADTIHDGAIVDTIGYYATISVPKLTSAILSSGEVRVFVNLSDSANADVVPLPYNDFFTGLNITPQFYVQQIALYSNVNPSTYTKGGQKYLQYRYLLVPGTSPARILPPPGASGPGRRPN